MAIFGKLKNALNEATESIAESSSKVISDLSDKTDRLRSAIDNATDSIAESSSKVISDLSDKTDRLRSAIDNATDSIAESSSKVISDLSDKTGQLGADISAKASELEKEIANAKILEWAKNLPDTLREYADNFNVEELWKKIGSTAKSAGQDIIVMVLSIYYAIESSISDLTKAKDNGKQPTSNK